MVSTHTTESLLFGNVSIVSIVIRAVRKLWTNRLAAMVLTCLGFASACQKKAQSEIQRPAASVAVASATTQDVPVYLDAIGKTVAREVVSIEPQVSGRILK